MLSNPRTLWKRYVVAISLVLTLVGGSHVASLLASNQAEADAAAIDVSGRQRMLSQRITYFASEVVRDDGADAREELRRAVTLFEASHTALIGGGRYGLDARLTPALERHYFGVGDDVGLDAFSREFITRARAVADAPATRVDDDWRWIQVHAPGDLLTSLNVAVQLFEARSRDAAHRLKRIEWISLALAVLILIGEAVFIFWPAHASIVKTLNTVDRANARLAKAVALARSAQRATHEARREAERAIEAKAAFLANLSHEIRTPLSGVLGIADALSGTTLDPSQRKMVSLIATSGKTAERLLSDVLELSKTEANRLALSIAPFSLRDAVSESVALFDAAAREKGVALTLSVDDRADGAFEGDEVRLRQIIANLVSNAVKFTDAGHIAVTVDAASGDDSEGVRHVAIVVEDTGIGFDEAARAVVFNRFEQAEGSMEREPGGTGLGLAICKAFVELMGGDIEAQSEPGRGSRFTVRLPLRRAWAADGGSAHSARSTDDVGLANLRVLTADDNPLNHIVTAAILKPLGVDLISVHNGADAVARANAEAFDCALMDMEMPHMDGLEAVRRIRADEIVAGRARLPIAMLSANALAHHIEAALAAGCDAHIAKPITAQNLIEGVVSLMSDAGPAEPARQRSA